MNRLFISGDIHGRLNNVKRIIKKEKTTKDDYLILLGDNGFNFFFDGYKGRDWRLKKDTNKLQITLLCIQGNHEERAENVPTYKKVKMFDDYVYIEDEFPNIIFLINGHYYTINGMTFFVAGGAWSIDKDYRISRGWSWFESQMMYKNELIEAEKVIALHNYKADFILTHTSPINYEPKELFLDFIDQSTVNKDMEHWLQDEVYDKMEFKRWFFGHYHGNLVVGNNIEMLFDKYIEILPNYEIKNE